MRLVLNYIDQLIRTTVENLPYFCDALVNQLQEIVETANAWAQKDHNDDGTHNVVRIGDTDRAPDPVAGKVCLYWDGTNLIAVKPDGTTVNVV